MTTAQATPPPPVMPTIPIGSILIFNFKADPKLFDKSGKGINSMSGWALCNGNNKTPNLQNRFVVGAGDEYLLEETGGEAEVSLNTSQMPSHGHSINNGDFGTLGIGVETDSDSKYIPYCSTGNTGTINTGNNGGGTAHNNLPPFYAAPYIMRIS